MSKPTTAHSSHFIKNARYLVLPIVALIALACTCSLPPIVLNFPVTVIVSQPYETPGEGVAAETVTPTSSPSPTPPRGAVATIISTRGVCPPGIVNDSCLTGTPTPPPITGGGDWGLTETDLEPVGVDAVSPSGTITLVIRNHGPDNFEDNLRVICIGVGILREGVTLVDPVNTDEVRLRSIPSGGTGLYWIEAGVDITNYDYNISCVVDAGEHDPNVSNNGIQFAVP